MTRQVLAAALLLLSTTASVLAQPRVAALEEQLPSLSGPARAHALTDLVDLLKNDGPRKALQYGEEALAFYAAHPDPAWEVRALDEMAWACMIVGDYARATAMATRARALAERTGDVKGLARALNNLGVMDQRRGNGAGAMGLFDASLRLYRQLGSDAEIAAELENLQTLSAALEKAGDDAGALAAYKKFAAESRQIFDEEKARRLETVEQRYQLEKREAEIQRLRSDEALRARAGDRQLLQRNVTIGGAVLLGVIGFGVYRRRVESARIAEELSITDTLTGLKNRRFVMQTIGADLAAIQRRRRDTARGAPADADLVFLLIDIDRFKSVNDEFGHRGGDAVLTQIAAILRDICRASDTLARWGGEEFMIISRFVDRRYASIFAERIRTEIEREAFDLGDGRTIRRTCSLGFASYPFSLEYPDALSWEQVVALADEALYVAKRDGANGWIGVTAAAGVTEETLRHRSSRSLSHWIEQGIVTIESNSRESGVGGRESVVGSR